MVVVGEARNTKKEIVTTLVRPLLSHAWIRAFRQRWRHYSLIRLPLSTLPYVATRIIGRCSFEVFRIQIKLKKIIVLISVWYGMVWHIPFLETVVMGFYQPIKFEYFARAQLDLWFQEIITVSINLSILGNDTASKIAPSVLPIVETQIAVFFLTTVYSFSLTSRIIVLIESRQFYCIV